MSDTAPPAPPALATCPVCPHHCRLAEGQLGACRARRAENGRVVPAAYGRLSALALDPIEKKPLAHFHPGRPILSVGFWGCNLHCPFCQNHDISQTAAPPTARSAAPEDLADLAARLAASDGNLGLAYTYNEPLVAWEYVRDTARLVRARGLLNVIVTNGVAAPSVVDALAPLLDAANVDLKGPSQTYYDWVGGDFAAACNTIATLHRAGVHVEVTTLVVPGRNDADSDVAAIADFLASLSPDIPLHLTRYFPRHRTQDIPATPPATLHRLAAVARRRLTRVHLGNL